jgi:hypothetical protein
MTELPTMLKSTNAFNMYSSDNTTIDWTYRPDTYSGLGKPVVSEWDKMVAASAESDRQKKLNAKLDFSTPIQEKKKEIVMTDKRRIVQVFIVDPRNDVPLKEAILYKGEQKLTDATDQELFFEINVNEVLIKHNKYIIDELKTLDKKATKAAGKDVFLDEIRIRDLKMIVSEIAVF